MQVWLTIKPGSPTRHRYNCRTTPSDEANSRTTQFDKQLQNNHRSAKSSATEHRTLIRQVTATANSPPINTLLVQPAHGAGLSRGLPPALPTSGRSRQWHSSRESGSGHARPSRPSKQRLTQPQTYLKRPIQRRHTPNRSSLASETHTLMRQIHK